MEKSHFLQRFLMGGAFAVITIWGMFNVFVVNSARLNAVDESGAIGGGTSVCEESGENTPVAGDTTEGGAEEADGESESDSDTPTTEESTTVDKETDCEGDSEEKPVEEETTECENESAEGEESDCEKNESNSSDEDESDETDSDEDESGEQEEPDEEDSDKEDNPEEGDESETEEPDDGGVEKPGDEEVEAPGNNDEAEKPAEEPAESEKAPAQNTDSSFEQEKPEMDVVTVIAETTTSKPEVEEKPVADAETEEIVSVVAVTTTRVDNEVSGESLATQDTATDNEDVIDGAVFDAVDDPAVAEEHDSIKNEETDNSDSPIPHFAAAGVAVMIVGGVTFLWVRQK